VFTRQLATLPQGSAWPRFARHGGAGPQSAQGFPGARSIDALAKAIKSRGGQTLSESMAWCPQHTPVARFEPAFYKITWSMPSKAGRRALDVVSETGLRARVQEKSLQLKGQELTAAMV